MSTADQPVLTPLERSVIQRLALGDTYRQAAHNLRTTEDIVDHAGRRTVEKLHARNLVHAAVTALDLGLIHPEECGTERTYRWHIRHGEDTDTLCRGALAAVRREQRQGGTE